MKAKAQMTLLAIVFAVMGSGCSSLRPPTAGDEANLESQGLYHYPDTNPHDPLYGILGLWPQSH
jgi:hypothetical protein